MSRKSQPPRERNQTISGIDVKFQQGLTLHQQGRLAEAERLYDEVLRRRPFHFDALHLSGVIAVQTGRAESGAKLIAKAISRDRNVAAAHNNLAKALNDLKRPSEALESCDKAIALQPSNAGAHNNRGVALRELKRFEAAVASFDQAIALKPDFAEAYASRSSALIELKRLGEALASCDKAIALRPDFAEAHSNRGAALEALNRYAEAAASYDRAIALRPDSAEVYGNRGGALLQLKLYEQALASCDTALALKPDIAKAHVTRGHVFFQLAENDKATRDFEQALAIEPDLAEAALASCTSELKILYQSEKEVIDRRKAHEEKLHRVCAAVAAGRLKDDLVKAVGASAPFFLAYQGLKDTDLQALYGTLVCGIMERAFPQAPLPTPPAPDEPVRVGFVSAFFRNHSNWKIPIKGWLSQLDRQRFKIFGYHVGRGRDAETSSAAALCDRFVDREMPLQEWRQEILADAPHVLIYPGLFMDEISLQLAAQRLAPVQCNSWGHPVTSGLPTLDYFLSSDLMEPPGASEMYSERLIRLPNLSFYYEPPEEPISSFTRQELGLRPEATVFWSGQSLFKYLPQFDPVFAEIAEQAGDCQFVFIKHPGAQRITELFKDRLEKAFAARGLRSDDHCVILDRLGAREFVGAINQCDVILDSIGWSGCNSVIESLPCNLPILTLPGPFMRARHSLAFLRMMGIGETVAESVADYVSIAARLARNSEERRAISRKIAERKHRLYSDRACIAGLEDFLDRAARQPTNFGAPAPLQIAGPT